MTPEVKTSYLTWFKLNVRGLEYSMFLCVSTFAGVDIYICVVYVALSRIALLCKSCKNNVKTAGKLVTLRDFSREIELNELSQKIWCCIHFHSDPLSG